MKDTTMRKRSDVKIEDTWNLTTIFETRKAWEQAFDELKATHTKASTYKGRLQESAATLYEAIQFQESIFLLLGKVYVYMHLNFDADTTNATSQADQANVMSLYGQIMASFSFFSSELMQADETVIYQYIKEKPELRIYKHDFDQLFRKREHILSEKEEHLLAEASEIFESNEQTFGMLNNADMKFPKIKDEKGETVELTHSRYGVLMESSNRQLREDAFRAMYKTYGNLAHTFASTLSGKVKTDNFFARVRNYPNARARALDANGIPENVYDTLLATVGEYLPLLHEYIALRKQVLKVDKLTMYDVYTPLIENIDLKFTFEEAKTIVLEALKPLGEEYQSLLKEAFASRWIDVYENIGKRSGAYSSGTYGTNPFILLNWQDNLDNVFTLVHELGHSMHSYYTRNNQPFVYGDYSIFVAEIASTTNENLLTDYLLKKYDDPNIKAYILNHYLDGFKGTVFRQTQFAEFEYVMHTAQQEGTALTVEYLSEQYADINQKYYGPAMFYDEEIRMEWSRIPHFYYNFYVYQYATGFTAASALANKIIQEGQPAVDAYLAYLKAGCSDYPIEVMKKAGVDMTTKQPIVDAMAVFKQRLAELTQLLSSMS